MPICGQKAVLLLTQEVADTSTSIARSRVQLCCTLEVGHAGPHADPSHPERWQGDGSRVVTLLRNEDRED
jgi:hypothetical protein